MLVRLIAALLWLSLACASTTPTAPTERDVVRAYRLFGWKDCDAVRELVASLDFSGPGGEREPFFRLLEGYCLELEGQTDAAKAQYASVRAQAPHTRQAFEAALRLRELERFEREGLTRARLKQQVDEQHESSPLYRHGIQPLERSTPVYPPAVLAARIQGWVLVDFGISSEGKVVDPVVLDSDPPFVFDAAALAVTQQWVYEKSQQPEPMRATVRVDFDIR